MHSKGYKMNYLDIIQENCNKHSPISWWPRFAFHYTDIQNAVSILNSGFLYSRAAADQLKIMKNDNASRQVIDITSSDVVSKVRFYFRPLTPTQYYNEGYKHPSLRYCQDENANVPVPIFLLFDLNKLLSLPGVQFSETSQAIRGSKVYSGIEKFKDLNFDYIYDNSYENFEVSKNFRHAEILHPNSMPIDSCICNILCRNNLERTTLLNLLHEKNNKAFLKYKEMIKVPRNNVFENNGSFLTDCSYHDRMVSITFSDAYAGKRYIEREMEKAGIDELRPIDVVVQLKWINSRNICNQKSIVIPFDVRKPGTFTITGLPDIQNAKNISIEVLFDNNLMCYLIQSLDFSELLR